MFTVSRILFLCGIIVCWQLSKSAPPVCRSCSKHCLQNINGTNSNSTDTDLLTDVDLQSSRMKRSAEGGEVEFRACTRFQIEMLLIPLSIAMIPIALCALIMCTCCCGPKDSRGKLPDDFLSNFPMSKKRRLGSEEFELEFRDGYVQRKDSSKTKFSTVVSYIEARRESLWSVRTDGGASVISGKDAEQNEAKTAQNQENSESVTDISALSDKLKKVPSTESMKKTRFSDTVSVISAESLPRR